MQMITNEISRNTKAGWNITNDLMKSGSTAAGGIIVAIIVIIWVHIKAFELVVRQVWAHRDNRPLRIAVGSCVLFALLFPVSNDKGTAFLLWDWSFWIMAAVAKIVEFYYSKLLQPSLSREYIVDQALHQPWWNVKP